MKRIAITAIRRRKQGGGKGEVENIKAGTLLNLEGTELKQLEEAGAVVATDDPRAAKFGYGPAGKLGRPMGRMRGPVETAGANVEIHSAEEADELGLAKGETDDFSFESEAEADVDAQVAADAEAEEDEAEALEAANEAANPAPRKGRKGKRGGENLV